MTMNEHDAFYFVHIMFGDTEVYFYCFQEDEKLPNINPRKLKYQVRPGLNPAALLRRGSLSLHRVPDVPHACP